MMGPRQIEQGMLFCNFSLDAHVPADHLPRSIDRFVELSELRGVKERVGPQEAVVRGSHPRSMRRSSLLGRQKFI